MDEFKLIYKILNVLREIPSTEFDVHNLSADLFKVKDTEFEAIMKILDRSGYISGLKIIKTIGRAQFVYDDVLITIPGLEFLKENSAMKKIKNLGERTIKILKN
jgi:hypothetical protein